MVEMGVGDEHGVDRLGVVGERYAASLRLRGRALEEAAVDDHPGTVGGQEELGARDRRRRAEELQLHGPTIVAASANVPLLILASYRHSGCRTRRRRWRSIREQRGNRDRRRHDRLAHVQGGPRSV
jgi:hypothetical protein